MLVPVAPLAHTDHAKAYGRVSGASFSYMGPYDLQAAPKEAVVLPTGSVARFNEGDAFFLYHQGAAHGDRFAAPALETKGTGQVLVEAGQGGVVVHGPAVLECVPDCTRLLSESVQAKTTIKATTAAMIAPSPTRTLLGGSPL